ncbi:MAG: efflux RND transporter periplasmic adaptor subunit, partial [Bacteroidota bacterium]
MKRYLVIISALSLLLHACGGSEEIQTVAIRPVKYAKIQERGASQTHTFSGTSQSSKETKLSFRVSGIINTLNVKVGQEVRQGQMIARLDPSDYNVMYEQSLAQLKSAETQIKQARAQRVSSKSNFDRIEKLYENNSLPLSDFDQAKTNYEAAESTFESALAQVAASQKQVESAANQLNYTQVNAPFSGIITQVMVEENELVNTGSPIASL